MPVCCSTVTPGKFATFCRSPVSLLKSVVLPELGGPITATVLMAPAGAVNSTTAAVPQLWQLLHSLISSSGLTTRSEMDGQAPGGFPPQRDFGTVHLKDPRIAARSAQPRRDSRPGQETEFHQALGIVARQIDFVKDRRVAPAQVYQCLEGNFRLAAVATELHLGFSMRRSEIVVNTRWPVSCAVFVAPACNCLQVHQNKG